MLVSLIVGSLLIAEAEPAAIIGTPEGTETTEVAYDTLAAGQAREAVDALEALRAENPGDPALLINLGSAYAELGEFAHAEAAYREAAESDIRYQLELADGSWVDSRRAARTALRNLQDNALAMN